MTAKSNLAVAVCASVALGLAAAHPILAHEGGEHVSYAAGEPGDSSKPSRTVEIVMGEGSGTMTYTPAEVDVAKGEQVRFIVKNAGTMKHEFFLDSVEHNAQHKRAMEQHPEMQHQDPNAQSVEPGQQVELLWKFSETGTFEFACLIPGHYEAGMHGKIIVR